MKLPSEMLWHVIPHEWKPKYNKKKINFKENFLGVFGHFIQGLSHCALHRLQNPKWPPGGPKMTDGVWTGVYPLVFGCSKQLSQNRFFDPTTPSLFVGDHPRVSG